MIFYRLGNEISRQIQVSFKMFKRPLSDYNEFQKVLNQAQNIVALTGAGVSAESGIPVFRGPEGCGVLTEPPIWRPRKRSKQIQRWCGNFTITEEKLLSTVNQTRYVNSFASHPSLI
jgi:hypothetical protein